MGLRIFSRTNRTVFIVLTGEMTTFKTDIEEHPIGEFCHCPVLPEERWDSTLRAGPVHPGQMQQTMD
jgi:hypothetical protein